MIPGVDKARVGLMVADGFIDDEAVVTGGIFSLGEFEVCSIFFVSPRIPLNRIFNYP